METDLPLRDIHLPAPIGWWPPAPGWWILLFGVPALAILLAWLWRFLRRKTPKKLALRELEAIANSQGDTGEKVRQIAILLRRTALSVYPREEVAGLVGEAWLAFLDAPLKHKPGRVGKRLFACPPFRRISRGQTIEPFAHPTPHDASLKHKGFSEGAGRLLIEAPYRRQAHGDLDALFALCREWIKCLPKPVGRSSPLKKALTQPSPTGRGLNQSLLKGSLPSTRKP